MEHKELAKLVDRLFKHLGKVGGSIDQEDIHAFRVAYKKLRAVVQLLAIADSEHRLGIREKLKDYYHIFGDLRDLQLVHDKWIAEVGAKDSFSVKIKRQIKRRGKLVGRIHIGKQLCSAHRKIRRGLPSQLNASEVLVFQQTCWQEIAVCAADLDDDYSIHLIRKRLKTIYYVEQIFGRSCSSPFHEKDDTDPGVSSGKNFLIELMKELGEYHDLCTAVNILCQEIATETEMDCKDLMLSVMSRWLVEKEDYRLLLAAKIELMFSALVSPIEYEKETYVIGP